MKKKNIIIPILIIIIITVILIFILPEGKDKPIVKNENYPPFNYPTEIHGEYQFYTISQLHNLNKSGIFNTEGYLVYLSYCPPCPSGADCAMCESPNIVISERNNFTERTYYEEIKIGEMKFRNFLSECKKTELVIDFSVPGLNPNIYHKFRWSTLNEWAYPFELDSMYKFTLEIVKPQEIGYYPTIDSCPRPTIIGKIIGIEKVE